MPFRANRASAMGQTFSLSARDHDALRAGGFQLKPFRQRSWHHTKRSASIHKKLDFFNTPRRTGQMAFYVEQSHIKNLPKNMAIVAQPTNNTTTLISLKKVQMHRPTLRTGLDLTDGVIEFRDESLCGRRSPRDGA